MFCMFCSFIFYMFDDTTERVACGHLLHSDEHSWLCVDPMLKMSFRALEWAWRQIWKLIKRGVSLCQHRWSQATPAPVWGASWKELFSNCFIIHLKNLLFVTFSRWRYDGGERESWVSVNLNRMRHDIIYCVTTMWSVEAGLQIFHWFSARQDGCWATRWGCSLGVSAVRHTSSTGSTRIHLTLCHEPRKMFLLSWL